MASLETLPLVLSAPACGGASYPSAVRQKLKREIHPFFQMCLTAYPRSAPEVVFAHPLVYSKGPIPNQTDLLFRIHKLEKPFRCFDLRKRLESQLGQETFSLFLELMGKPQPDFEDLLQMEKMAVDPQELFKVADRGLEAIRTHILVWRDEELWEQFRAARKQPLEMRVALLRKLVQQVKNSQEFYDRIQKELRPFHRASEIQHIVASYFPLYRDGILSDPSVIQQVKWILDRVKMAVELDFMDEGYAAEARATFSQYLYRLKQLSLCDVAIYKARRAGLDAKDWMGKRKRVQQELEQIRMEKGEYLDPSRRVKNSREFYQQLEKEVLPYHKAFEIQHVVDAYFPLYGQGVLESNPDLIKQIKWILDRATLGMDLDRFEDYRFVADARRAFIQYVCGLKDIADCEERIYQAQMSGENFEELIEQRDGWKRVLKIFARENMKYLKPSLLIQRCLAFKEHSLLKISPENMKGNFRTRLLEKVLHTNSPAETT